MSWNSKTEIIAMLLAVGGFALVAVVIGIIAPIIINIKQGDLGGITTIVILLALIFCAIYFLRCRNHKIKKPKDGQKQ
jgi:predicted ABC-type exoprotein transport system permease subunit